MAIHNRNILELHEQGKNQRDTPANTENPRDKIWEMLRRSKANELRFPIDPDTTDEYLGTFCFQNRSQSQKVGRCQTMIVCIRILPNQTSHYRCFTTSMSSNVGTMMQFHTAICQGRFWTPSYILRPPLTSTLHVFEQLLSIASRNVIVDDHSLVYANLKL